MQRMNSEHLRDLLKVYFIMGSVNCRKAPVKVLQEAVAGGITMFQFREKGTGSLSDKARLNLGRRLQKICHANGVPFIVNDDIDLAIALDADGIHVGQEDTPALAIRTAMIEELRNKGITIPLVGIGGITLQNFAPVLTAGADGISVISAIAGAEDITTTARGFVDKVSLSGT